MTRMMSISQRSCQVWAVLAWAARHRQTITYVELSAATGILNPGLGKALEPIQSYCMLNELPALTAIVVKQTTGMPGVGFTGASANQLAQEFQRVFTFDWLAHGAPTPDVLEDAVTRLPSRGP